MMKRLMPILFFWGLSCLAFGQIDSTIQKIATDSVSEEAKKIEGSLVNSMNSNSLEIPDDANNEEDGKIGPLSISEYFSLPKIFWASVFLLAGYVLIRLITRILEILAERSTKYRITIKGFIPIVKILGWLGLIFIIVAGIFKPPAATILAFSASIGVAIGFASQDLLKNIFGGIMILFDRPFQSGDKIEVGGHYGEVIAIGLRSTRIVTPNDSVVSIPNSEVMNTSVSNTNFGESNCQVVVEIYLPIDADTIAARRIGIKSAQVSKYVYLNKPISVIFTNEFKDRKSLLKMKIKAYVFDIRDEFKFKSDITEIAIPRLLSEGIINDGNGID